MIHFGHSAAPWVNGHCDEPSPRLGPDCFIVPHGPRWHWEWTVHFGDDRDARGHTETLGAAMDCVMLAACQPPR